MINYYIFINLPLIIYVDDIKPKFSFPSFKKIINLTDGLLCSWRIKKSNVEVDNIWSLKLFFFL